MPFINGLALPSKPLAKNIPVEKIQSVTLDVQQAPATPTNQAAPTPSISPPQQQQQQPAMPPFEAPPPAPPVAPPVAMSAFEHFQAEFFGLTEPPSAPQQHFLQDANKTAAARMVARRQAEIRVQLLRDHQQARAQAQLTAVAAQMQHEQQKKEKKARGVRMTCLRCGKNKPVNAKNDGITCSECLRKKRRQESLALISSPPKSQPLAPPTPPPAPQMEMRTFGNVRFDFELPPTPPGLNFDAMGTLLAEGEVDTGKWRKSFDLF